MKYIFIYQSYVQQPSLTQNDVFENVLCNVYEGKAFGKTYLKFIPANELLDTTDSDSTGSTNTTISDEDQSVNN